MLNAEVRVSPCHRPLRCFLSNHRLRKKGVEEPNRCRQRQHTVQPRVRTSSSRSDGESLARTRGRVDAPDLQQILRVVDTMSATYVERVM